MIQRLRSFVLSLSKHEWFKSLLTDFSIHPSTSSGRTEKSVSKVLVIGCAVPKGHKRNEVHLSSFTRLMRLLSSAHPIFILLKNNNNSLT